MKTFALGLALTFASTAFADDDSGRAAQLAGSVKVGLVVPGSISPYTILLTRTSVAPYFGVDGQIGWKYFAAGVYAQVAPLTGPPTLHGADHGTSSYNVISVGAAPKAQLPLFDDALILRLGIHLGFNLTFGRATFSSSSHLDTVGLGIDAGPTLEASVKVSSWLRIVGQFAFFSQPAGTTVSSSDGKNYNYPYAPFFFFAVGPEFIR